MTSEDRLPVQPKYCFGFSGTAKRLRSDDVTVDEILDSMSRRAELSDQIDEEALRRLEDEREGPGPIIDYSEEGLRVPRIPFGKVLAVLVLAGSVLSLWFYGGLGMVDFSAIDRLASSPSYASIFTDPVKLVVLALVCFVPVILLRWRSRPSVRLTYQ